MLSFQVAPVPFLPNSSPIVVRKILSATLQGISALPVVIEVDSSMGLPGFSMVGLPDSAVRESRERVVSAMRSCGFQGMSRRITVNLAPADVRKEGSAFDLALAIGMLLATEQLECNHYHGMLFLGELSLDGCLQPVRGVLSIAVCARENGWILVVPKMNLSEALSVKDVKAIGVETLQECVALLSDVNGIQFQRGVAVLGCGRCV